MFANLFHLRKNGQAVTRQYKVVYDEDYLARTFHRAPASCADLPAEAEPAAVNETKEQHLNPSADALLAFGRGQRGPLTSL